MEKSSNRRFGVRTVAAIVAGLMVGGMCTAMTASAADDSAAGYSATAPVNLTRPATVPSMDAGPTAPAHGRWAKAPASCRAMHWPRVRRAWHPS